VATKDGQLLQLALARFGAPEVAKMLSVPERVVDAWLAGTQSMPDLKRLQLVELLRKAAK
jgi:hypothetical protein